MRKTAKYGVENRPVRGLDATVAMGVKESDIQKDIIHYLKIMGALCWRNNSIGIYDKSFGGFRKLNGYGCRVGVSDILGIWRGRFLAIEVKSPKGKLTEAQSAFLLDVQRHGGIAFCARSLNDVMRMLNDDTHGLRKSAD